MEILRPLQVGQSRPRRRLLVLMPYSVAKLFVELETQIRVLLVLAAVVVVLLVVDVRLFFFFLVYQVF